MEKGAKVVACICVFSMLVMGCYSSTLIEPKEDERDKVFAMHAKDIKTVVTKNGMTHQFRKTSLFRNEPTTIVKDSIVGYSNGRRVSIPFSEVSLVFVTEFQPAMTAVAVLGGVGLVVGLVIALTAVSEGTSFGSL